MTTHTLREEKGRKLLFGEFPSSHKRENIYFKSNLATSPQKKHFHLVILHDLGEYHRRYLDLGHYLTRQLGRAVSITWMDLLGHGFSGGSRAHVDVFDCYCQDVISLIETKTESEVLLLGQGLGATIALKIQRSLKQHLSRPLKGLILSNPALTFRWSVPDWIQNLVPSYFGPMRKLKLPFSLRGEMLGHHPEHIEEYNADPLISHSITIGLFHQVTHAGLNLMKVDSPLEVPTLALFSGKKVLYQGQESRTWMEKICEKAGEIRDYPTSGHDLFNEIQRDVVFQDVYNWIKNDSKL